MPPFTKEPYEPALNLSKLSPKVGHPTRLSFRTAAEDSGITVLPAGRWARFKRGCRVAWHRLAAEFWLELPLLKSRLLVIILCGIFQYVHAVFTALAYHLHKPLPEPLHDIGFEIFPALGESMQGLTEALVYTGFGIFGVWLVSPFVTRRKSFHTVVVLKRVLVILITCQVLRIITFLATQIPAPNYHCLADEPTSTLPWPAHWWQNIIVNVSRQASHSCGDLIFSSHTTFLLVFMWTYVVMGRYLALKVLACMYVAATSCLIIASRKHYSVDVVVAWYVVPAFFFHFKRRWTTLRDDVATADGKTILIGSLLPTTAVAASTMPGTATLVPTSRAGPAAAVAGGSVGAEGGGPAAKGSQEGNHRGFERLLSKLRLSSPAKGEAGGAAPVGESASVRLLSEHLRESETGEAGALQATEPHSYLTADHSVNSTRGDTARSSSESGGIDASVVSSSAPRETPPPAPLVPSWVGVDLEAGGATASLNTLHATTPNRQLQGGAVPASPSGHAAFIGASVGSMP